MNTRTRTAVAAVAILLCAAGSARAVSPLLKEFEDAFIRLGETIIPSVVEISAETVAPATEDQSLNDLFRFGPPQIQPGPQDRSRPDVGQPPGPLRPPRRQNPRGQRPPPSRQSTGSGFIYDTLGHIITNNHVVEGATKLTVELSDGTKRIAEVVGLDPNSDLAVIKIDPEGLDLVPVTISDAEEIKVGQFAIAVGSPRGLTGSLSFGHVSAVGREELNLPGGLRFQGFIQTDAAINLGNSGGPLCDLAGNVIGVNVAIAYGANSIGFAIPVSRVRQVVPQLIATGEVVRGWLGVGIWDIDQMAEQNDQEVEDYIEAYGLESADGVWITYLNPEGPAEAAGLRVDDVVLKIDGIPIKNRHELIDRISDTKPGIEVVLNVWRAGDNIDVPVSLEPWQGEDFATWGRDYFGIHVRETTLNAEQSKWYSLEEGQKVTVVARVLPDSPAMKARLKENDIILQIAQLDIAGKDSFLETLKDKARQGKTLLINVARSGRDGNVDRVICFPKIPEDFSIE